MLNAAPLSDSRGKQPTRGLQNTACRVPTKCFPEHLLAGAHLLKRSQQEAHEATQINNLTTQVDTMSAQMANLGAGGRSYRGAHSAAQPHAALSARQAQGDEVSALTGQL